PFRVAGIRVSCTPQDYLFARVFMDMGSYKVYQRDRALGTEPFEFDSRGDSIAIFRKVQQVLPGPGGDLPIEKSAMLIVGSLDYDLRSYQSQLKAHGKDMSRGLVVNDTAFTAYRESSTQGGSGDRYLRPPGRVFVLDGQV